MNTLKKRIAGMVAAGLLTVSGTAAIAQPAFAADKSPTTENFVDACESLGGSATSVTTSHGSAIGCNWKVGNGNVTVTCGTQNGTVKPNSCGVSVSQTTTPVRKLSIRSSGMVVVTTAGTRVKVKQSATTGITTVQTPGSKPVRVIPPSAVTGPGSPVVKPVTPVTQPAPPANPSRPGTGIVTKPSGAIG